TTINAFQLSSADASKVTDQLFTIVKEGKTTIKEIAGSFGRVAAIAAPAGVSINELGAAMAALTAQGQSTEEATTAIRSAIVELQKPSTELAEALASVGVENSEAFLRNEGLAASIDKVKEAAVKNNTTISQLISNIRSMQAILPLATTASSKFASSAEEMANSANAAKNAFDFMDEGITQSFKKLRANIANMVRTIGTALTTALQPTIDKANEIFEDFGQIGWDEVAKRIGDNWTEISKELRVITEIILEPLPRIIAGVFKIAGKAAIIAFKMGWHAAGITIKSLMFPADEDKNIAKTFDTIGQDATQRFLKSGKWEELGPEIANKLKNSKSVAEWNKAIGEISETSGLEWVKNFEKRAAGEFKKSTGSNMFGIGEMARLGAVSFNDALDKGLSQQQLEETFGQNLDKASSALDISGMFKESSNLIAGMWGLSEADVQKINDAVDRVVNKIKQGQEETGGGEDPPAKDPPIVPQPIIPEIVTQEQVDLVAQRYQQMVDKYKLSTEEIASLGEEFRKWQSETDNLTFEQQIANIETLGEKYEAAGVKKSEVDKWVADQSREIEDKKSALINQGFADGAAALEGFAAVNKNASKENFAVWKGAAQVQAVVDTYASAQAAFKSLAGIPVVGPALGYAAAAAAVAAGMQRVAMIRSQKFQEKKAMGGVVSGMRGTDNVPAMLTAGEFVVSRQSTQAIGQDRLEELNASGQMAGTNQTINIQTFDTAGLENYVRMNPEEFAKAFRIAKNSGYLETE
ncbi:MAG: phage tail tape measure protein, partial [Anaerolineales bacterium]|nr:phage tail tape measure protein [Anaerolineales bacterium]